MRRVSLVIAALLVAAVVPGSVTAHEAAENEPPLADAGLDQEVERGTVVWLDGGGSLDPDGDIVASEWSIRTPDGREINPNAPTAMSTTFTASTVGRYEVTLTVTDDHGVDRSDTLYVDVAARGRSPRAPNPTSRNRSRTSRRPVISRGGTASPAARQPRSPPTCTILMGRSLRMPGRTGDRPAR
ncbi:PKD domain-containing protein [Halobaculum halobium]|uniref:PKD domain-containing protein n=1 Tax=Halobaculum halobium TaxID=3032281 RepID=UPI0036128589